MGRRKFTKLALILSVVLLVAWSLLGTGATIAWFTDVAPAVKNSFLIGQMDLDVFYHHDGMEQYAPVDASTPVFNDEALYEPNYTQVVHLRIENNGQIPFRYKLSVDMRSCRDSTNVYGMTLHLPQHLRYGVVYAATEAELDRELAQLLADRDMMDLHLNQYSQVDTVQVAPRGCRYAALVVYMPREVGNEANHQKGAQPPSVALGITVFAQQADAPLA